MGDEAMHLKAMIQAVAVVETPALCRFHRRRISYRRIAVIRSYFKKLSQVRDRL